MAIIRGKIISVSGPLVTADNMHGASLQDVCHVGANNLIGEIIEITGDTAAVQVYEDTSGLAYGDPLICMNEPLSVELGPGLIAQMFDGIQRPLDDFMRAAGGDYLTRGVSVPSLNRNKLWHFTPVIKPGEYVSSGDIIGTVQETTRISHKIMVPHGRGGTVISINEGDFRVSDIVCEIQNDDATVYKLSMLQRWPVRRPRPVTEKINPNKPLLTGQRVIDTFFPVMKGGTTTVPGPFGAGKTVIQHQIAKWADVDIVVYIGCGERGNEMTDIVKDFPKLIDPMTGLSIMERTILIANTSNMPVAAREASIYTGITIAEYYRDMGYDIAIMADSTSRWAEALRELSGRLEEMPGDEGYPAYLGSRLSSYYERAGKVVTVGTHDREGSITAVSAVSPPGGDLSEPVTQNTLRVVKVFWSLDSALARQRHFPAINWMNSYSMYSDQVNRYYDQYVDENASANINKALSLLHEENRLLEIVKLVGFETLSDADKLKLEISKSIREDYLQQNATHATDAYSSLKKQYKILRLILEFYQKSMDIIESGVAGFNDYYVQTAVVRERIARVKFTPEAEVNSIDDVISEISRVLDSLRNRG